MPFDLAKANKEFKTIRTDYARLEQREDALEAAQVARISLTFEAAKEIARLVTTLRKQGIDGKTYLAFAKDKDVKQVLDMCTENISYTKNQSETFIKELGTFRKELVSFQKECDKAAGVEKKEAKKNKDGPPGGGKKAKGGDAASAADLADDVTELLGDFDTRFDYRMKWSDVRMTKKVDEILTRGFDKAAEVAPQDTVEEMKRRLEPRLLTKRLAQAKALLQQVNDLGGDAKSGGNAATMKKEGAALLKELQELSDELSEAVASIDEKKILPLKDSPDRKAKGTYDDYMDAVAGTKTIAKYAEDAELAYMSKLLKD